jgi:hypothetical protein
MSRCPLSVCLVILMWACFMSSGKRYPVGVLNDTFMLTMTRTCLRPKSSSMRFGYSYSRDMRFSTYGLTSICFIFVLVLTLTIQDSYDGGNESSTLVSIIIFGRFIKTRNHYFPLRKGLSFTYMLSLHLLPLCTV